MAKPLTKDVNYIANLFNMTTRRVQQLEKDGIIQKAKRNEYDVVSCVQAYVRYLSARSTGTRNDDDVDTKKARTRLLEAQADQAEIDLQIKKGVIAYKDEIHDYYANLVTNFRARALALPRTISIQGFGLKTRLELEDLTTKKIEEALNELSENGAKPRSAKPVRSGSKKGKAASKTKRK